MSVTNILSKLKEINDSNLVSVYVPSVGKSVNFKPISVKQQKDLIKSGLDGHLSGITISNTISQIILDNSVEKHSFVVTDKYPIIIALRRQSFGSEVLVKQDEKQINFNLDKILSRKLQYSSADEYIIELSGTTLKAYLNLVSLEDDIKINNIQLEKSRKNKDEEISETVGSLFIYEIVKFVSKIEIDEENVVDMSKLPIKDRLTIVENIPATLNNQILEYIQKFRKEETDYITVDGEILPIDARLFSKE
jgi:hypothetical protein